MSTYNFVTTWTLAAPLEMVWDAVYESTRWPTWWRDIESVVELEPGDKDGIGNVRRYTMRTRLPYSLVFDIRTMTIKQRETIVGATSGELAGQGRWQFSHANGTTQVQIDWDVSTTRRWMNLLGPFARPLFAWNHAAVMRRGGEDLARHLGARIVSMASAEGQTTVSEPGMPRYVDRWGYQASPQPFVGRQIRAYSFIVDGDIDRIQDLLDRYLVRPSGGAVEYQAVSSHVVVAFMQARSLAPMSPPFSQIGWMEENEVSIWVMAAPMERHLGIGFGEGVHWFNPYIFLDNGLAIAYGREIYGFPKEIGWPEIPDDPATARQLTLDALAFDRFDPNTQGRRQRVLEVTRTAEPESGEATRAWDRIEHAANEFGRFLATARPGGASSDVRMPVPGISFLADVAGDVAHRRGHMIFLKQFYDAAEGGRACYQAIVRAPMTVTAFRRGMQLPGRYEVAFSPLESHPIARDLGLTSRQPSLLSWWLDFDFEIGPGEVIWKAE
jgi:hypothetical protein